MIFLKDVTKLTDKELHEIKDLVSAEISRRYKAKLAPKRRKCYQCEYCKYISPEEREKYNKHPWNATSSGPYCFCGHPKGKLIPWGHTTPSWCKKGKDL